MAFKIEWSQPEDDSVISVEISRSTNLYGSYTVIDTIDATSDGAAKSADNTWVTEYTDPDGTKNHWYKIRFFDGTYYSEYADATTSQEMLRLCTIDEIKQVIETVGRWTDDEIFNKITETDDLVYIEFGSPIQAIRSEVLNRDDGTTPHTLFYVGEENIYRVDRVFYTDTEGNTIELYLNDEYDVNLRNGMIRILPYMITDVTFEQSGIIEIQYVPKIYNRLAVYRTCQSLLDQHDTLSGGKTSKELQVIEKRLKEVEQIVANKNVLQVSSDSEHYDSLYGVNRKAIRQNFERNIYIGSTGVL
jgi:hypothetical protein